MLIEAIGTGILLFTILGIVDTRSPEGWAGLVIGLVVVAIIITVGPVTNASLNPARAIGPLFATTIHGGVHNWTQQFLAYIPANLVGAALACFAYDWMATPRKIARPIKEAVTEPDRGVGDPIPSP
jgi:glycerol uptake facilitator protein